MGILVGDDGVNPQTGVAPGATFFAAAGLAKEGGDNLSLLKAMQFVTAPGDAWGQIDPEAGAAIVNNSWGGKGPRFSYTTALRNMAAAGMVNVFAAGNNGRTSSDQNLGDPAEWDDAITVGAVDKHREVTDFSSKGPSPVTSEFKPYIVAPGKDVESLVPGGKREAWSGTSMAAPHIAGALALVDEALVKAKSTPLDLDDAKFVLQRMAKDIGPKGPDDASGYGLVDLHKLDGAVADLLAARTAAKRHH
jgi:subtilisin family serine protease